MHWIAIAAVFCVSAVIVKAGETARRASGHKVVFEFVSQGPEQQNSVLNNVENLRKALGADTEVMVIAHGPGLELLLKTNSTHATRIGGLRSNKVIFAACENTLRRKKLTKQDLQEGIVTVDSGVAEVVRRQGAGWSYIKSGH